MPVIRNAAGEKWSYPSGQEKGTPFHIEWQGDIGKMLLKAADRLKNYRPMLETIGRQVVGSSKRSFVNQRSPEGEPWQPLKQRRRRGHNQNMIVLFDTGRLYRSISYRVISTNAVAIAWGPHYGKHHQYGAPAAHIPQRKFLGVGPNDIPATVKEWAEGVFKWPR